MRSDWIDIDAEVCKGRSVLRGTRIAVQSVLEMLAAGDSVEDVLAAFPSLRREQVLACVDHAARLMGNVDWRDKGTSCDSGSMNWLLRKATNK